MPKLVTANLSNNADPCVLRYTTSDNQMLKINAGAFEADIISHTYSNEEGIIIFDKTIISIEDYAFKDCSNLATVIIPNGVTSIRQCAFCDCNSLTTITIPNSIIEMELWAFCNCNSLKKIYITDLSAWCRIRFSCIDSNPLYNGANLYLNNELVSQLIIPSDITEIRNYTFSGCTSFASVIIPNNITTIDTDAFKNCINLTSITISDSISSIGDRAFCNCNSLVSVTIPDSVISIGEFAFYNCKCLTSANIGNGVNSIGRAAFSGCSSLIAFYGKFASEDNRCLIVDGVLNSFASSGLTSYNIPSNVTSIGYMSFCNSSNLESVTIPNSVTSTEGAVFCNCNNLMAFYGKFASEDNRCLIIDGVLDSFAPSGLTKYDIPNNVISIGFEASCNWRNLVYITIPNSVTSIRLWGFSDCSNLKTIVCKAAVPPKLDGVDFVFGNIPEDATIVIPEGCKEAYMNSDWRYLFEK